MSKEITVLIPNNMKIKIVPPPETKYNMDFEGRVQQVWSIHCPQEMRLRCYCYFLHLIAALQASPSVVAARLPADNLICIAYFTTLSALASKIHTEATQSATG